MRKNRIIRDNSLSEIVPIDTDIKLYSRLSAVSYLTNPHLVVAMQQVKALKKVKCERDKISTIFKHGNELQCEKP